MKRIYLIISILFFSSVSYAQSRSGTSGYGIYLEETFFPVYVNENDTTAVTNSTTDVADEKGLGFYTRTTLGYMLFGGSWMIGLTYNYYTLTTKRAAVAGGDEGLKESTNESQFGPTIGWFSGGFRTLFTFFVSGEKEFAKKNFNDAGTVTSNVMYTNKDVSGFQLTLGYTFTLWGVEFGPSLVYSSVLYGKQKFKDKQNPGNNISTFPLSTDNKKEELNPMISIIARF